MTNATKAHIIALVNALLALAASFHWISEGQVGALGLVVNALLGLYVATTYKNSPKRIA